MPIYGHRERLYNALCDFMTKHPVLFCALTALSFAACESARTQNEPQVLTTPPAVSGTTVPAATPEATATPVATPAAAPIATPAAASSHGKKLTYNSCNVDGPYIAMTFDDGPSAKLTPKLLDMLKERHIKATFFVVGQNAAENPEIIKRMVDEGHEVANHSWSHPALNKLGADGLRAQMEKTNDAIVAGGAPRPTLMRPPYGATSASLDRVLNEQYKMIPILWSVDPLDWKVRNANHVHDVIVAQAHPGAIILSHDIHATTVAAMPQTFDDLLKKGYKFVTVSELIEMDKPLPPKPSPTATPTPAPKASPTAKPKKPKHS